MCLEVLTVDGKHPGASGSGDALEVDFLRVVT